MHLHSYSRTPNGVVFSFSHVCYQLCRMSRICTNSWVALICIVFRLQICRMAVCHNFTHEHSAQFHTSAVLCRSVVCGYAQHCTCQVVTQSCAAIGQHRIAHTCSRENLYSQTIVEQYKNTHQLESSRFLQLQGCSQST